MSRLILAALFTFVLNKFEMATLNNKILLSELINRNTVFIKIVEEKYSKLTDAQLYQKPSAEKWSIAECLIHLIKADEIYLKQFEKQITEKPNADLNFKPGWLGNYFANMIVPKQGKLQSTMKSLKVMDPQVNIEQISKEFKNGEEVLTKFITQQKTLNQFMQTGINTDLGSIKIQTAIPLVKINLGDAFRFIVGHNERHIWQAEKVFEGIV